MRHGHNPNVKFQPRGECRWLPSDVAICNGAALLRTTTKEKTKIGCVVLLLKEQQKRHTWPLGRVMELIHGRDNLVRSVKILTDGSVVTRPIQHVVPLLEDTHNE